MLLSEIGDKEIVDITSGSMHGKLWDAEMIFDEETGTIKSLLVRTFSMGPAVSRESCSCHGARYLS